MTWCVNPKLQITVTCSFAFNKTAFYVRHVKEPTMCVHYLNYYSGLVGVEKPDSGIQRDFTKKHSPYHFKSDFEFNSVEFFTNLEADLNLD